MSAVQIDVDDNGWAKVVLRDETDGLDDITLEIPEAEDFEAMERAAIAKLGEVVRRTLQSQEEIDGALSWGRRGRPMDPAAV